MSKQILSQLDDGEVRPYVFLCGDPRRVPTIAEAVGAPREVRVEREYTVWEASLDGRKVTVASTGMGGPSTAILIEEMARLGAHTFIRIGTSGGLKPEAKKGELVIATGAIRADGTSRSYVWPEYPAVATWRAVAALVEAAEAEGHPYHVGLAYSVDGFYSENKILAEDRSLTPMAFGGFQLEATREKVRDAVRAGAVNIEMESATLFTLAGLFNLTAGMVCIVSDVVPWHPTEDLYDPEEGMHRAINVAVSAMRKLMAG